jgi:phage major head subunit gpT-like protein
MITTGNWQDALEPIARVSFRVGLKEIPAERDMLFSVESSDKLTETYLETGDIGSMEEFTGGLAYDDVAQGYKMTITAREFAKGIKIQRKFVRTDQLDIVKSLPKMLGLAARRRIATDVFYGYNNAFNTSITTLDALQLCSSAHTSNNGGSNQSNRGTSAFPPCCGSDPYRHEAISDEYGPEIRDHAGPSVGSDGPRRSRLRACE